MGDEPSDVRVLINTIRRGSSYDPSGILFMSRIRNEDMLIEALEDMDRLIGAKKAKRDVIRQLKFILVKGISPGKGKGHMLHTVIYGPPGTGKTTLGTILSRIWTALGVTTKRSTVPLTGLRKAHENLGKSFMRLDALSNREKTPKDAKKDIDGVTTILSTTRNILAKEMEKRSKANAEIIRDKILDLPIKIVSRPDFVAEYLGQSGPRTRRLLERNRGSVVFIDEAYSLHNGGRDTYGSEALTELNRFMSENPRDCIVIFSGYKDKMEQGIFTAQKGLKRRCSWVFEIPGYSYSELAEIFRLQVSEQGWTIEESVDLDKFFQKHLDRFPHYGGDTLKLLFQTGLAMSSAIFDDIVSSKEQCTDAMFEPLMLVFTELGEKPPPDKSIMDKIKWTVTNSVLSTAMRAYLENNVDERMSSCHLTARMYS